MLCKGLCVMMLLCFVPVLVCVCVCVLSFSFYVAFSEGLGTHNCGIVDGDNALAIFGRYDFYYLNQDLNKCSHACTLNKHGEEVSVSSANCCHLYD